MKKTKQKMIPGLWWVGMVAVLLLSLGVWVGLSYNSLIWQMADALFQNMVISIRSEQLTQIMALITDFGFYGSLIIWMVVGAILVIKKEWWLFGLCGFLAAGGYGFGYGLKVIVSRPRPEDALISEIFHSFPSLHALTAAILYLSIAYLVYHYSRKFWLSYFVFLLGLAVLLIISFSRIYLGVHYFSDVVGGVLLGTGWLSLALFLEKWICLIVKKTHKSVKI